MYFGRNETTMFDPSTENSQTKKEIEIRGRYLVMACDIEFSMLNVIMFCHPDPYNHTRAGQFKRMQMAGKIQNMIADLKQYKMSYYQMFENDLKDLEEFRIVRNDMAHAIGRFTNEDLSVFRIDYVDVDENGTERMYYKEYTEDYIRESLNLFSHLNGILFALWMKLKAEFELNQNNASSHSPSIGTFY